MLFLCEKFYDLNFWPIVRHFCRVFYSLFFRPFMVIRSRRTFSYNLYFEQFASNALTG